MGNENTPQLYRQDSPNKKKWNSNQVTNAQNHSPTQKLGKHKKTSVGRKGKTFEYADKYIAVLYNK